MKILMPAYAHCRRHDIRTPSAAKLARLLDMGDTLRDGAGE